VAVGLIGRVPQPVVGDTSPEVSWTDWTTLDYLSKFPSRRTSASQSSTANNRRGPEIPSSSCSPRSRSSMPEPAISKGTAEEVNNSTPIG
jgi:hypothetical protein